MNTTPENILCSPFSSLRVRPTLATDGNKKHKRSECPYLHVKKCKGCGRSCDCYSGKIDVKPKTSTLTWNNPKVSLPDKHNFGCIIFKDLGSKEMEFARWHASEKTWVGLDGWRHKVSNVVAWAKAPEYIRFDVNERNK